MQQFAQKRAFCVDFLSACQCDVELLLNLQQLKERVLRLTLPTKTKIAALKALQKNGRCAPKDIQGVVYDLICTPMVEKDLDDAESLEEWRDEIIYSENLPMWKSFGES